MGRNVLHNKVPRRVRRQGYRVFLGGIQSGIPQNPLACKKRKADFDSLVAKCISRDLLTTDMIRKFSRQARSSMLTYSSLQFNHKDKGQEQVMSNNTFTHTKIENMKKC